MNQDKPTVAALDESEAWSHRLGEPLPRRKLGPGILTLLWILRVYVLIAVPRVIYAFFNAIQHRH
jgi:hypothetical protein